MNNLLVSEIFGPTIQGEGPHTGQRATFLRLGGCNLTCSWCDSAYTWDGKRYSLKEELHKRSASELAETIRRKDAELLVLTGGEPLLQQGTSLFHLLHSLEADCHVDVETNGTIRPTLDLIALVQLFVVSPKLGHAEVPNAIRMDVLEYYSTLPSVLKIVCRTTADVEEAARLADEACFPRSQTWVMPEGIHPAQVLMRQRDLADATLALGMNLSSRLHVLIWGNERGH